MCKEKFHVRCAKRGKVIVEATCECMEPKTVFVASEEATGPGGVCVGGISNMTLTLLLVMEFIVIIVLYFLVYG